MKAKLSGSLMVPTEWESARHLAPLLEALRDGERMFFPEDNAADQVTHLPIIIEKKHLSHA